MKKGTPQNVIFLVSGGPGGSSALVAWTAGIQFADSLQDNFAIHILSLRGTYKSEPIIPKNWQIYPSENLKSYISDAKFPPFQAYSFTNAARDLIYAIRDAKSAYGASPVYQAAGFSYGTVILQRVATLDPNILSDYLMDGSVPQRFEQQPFIFQSIGLASLQKKLS